jgi:arylsulfatase A-like enzyme
MLSPVGVRRVVLVVLDGLRPDAIDTFGLNTLKRLRAGGASTMRGTTVAPSVTAAAMASLLTGVSPMRHGIRTDRFHIPRVAGKLSPLPRVLAEATYPSSGFMAAVPPIFRGVASRIAAQLGINDSRFVGEDAPGILQSARHALSAQRRGLILLHWPDADRAGHEHGWMSEEYGEAAIRLDTSLCLLMALAEIPRDRGTLLVTLSDHGGGGADPRDHESDHPLDRQILISMIGGGVRPGILREGASIMDVPSTILWALGVPVPADYSGTPFCSAFRPQDEPDPRPSAKGENGHGEPADDRGRLDQPVAA